MIFLNGFDIMELFFCFCLGSVAAWRFLTVDSLIVFGMKIALASGLWRQIGAWVLTLWTSIYYEASRLSARVRAKKNDGKSDDETKESQYQECRQQAEQF